MSRSYADDEQLVVIICLEVIGNSTGTKAQRIACGEPRLQIVHKELDGAGRHRRELPATVVQVDHIVDKTVLSRHRQDQLPLLHCQQLITKSFKQKSTDNSQQFGPLLHLEPPQDFNHNANQSQHIHNRRSHILPTQHLLHHLVFKLRKHNFRDVQ